MANKWRENAVVWLNDSKRGRILAGPFGFAWWEKGVVHVASFHTFTPAPVTAFKQFKDWDQIKKYSAVEAPESSVLRFVRSGLLPPAQGKLA